MGCRWGRTVARQPDLQNWAICGILSEVVMATISAAIRMTLSPETF